MGDQVSLFVELTIKPGELDNFKALANEMVASTRSESGASSFELFIDEARSVVLVHERYADSAAVMTHLRIFAEKFATRFLAAAEPRRFEVLGAPSDQLKEALSGFSPAYLDFLGGFAR